MSNWLDVKIDLYSNEADLESVHNALDKWIKSKVLERRDKNTGIYFGSKTFKFVWCHVKTFDVIKSNAVVCHTKCGFDEHDALDVCGWIASKYPAVNKISIQTRDDDSKIFAIYHWNRQSKNSVVSRRIDPMRYPDIPANLKDSYADTILNKKFAVALKNACLCNEFHIDKPVQKV